MRSGAIVKSFNNLHASKKNKNWLSKVQKIATQSWQNLETEWNYQNITGNVCFTPLSGFCEKKQKQTKKKTHTHTQHLCNKAQMPPNKQVLLLLGTYIFRWDDIFLPQRKISAASRIEKKKPFEKIHLLQSEAPPRGPPWDWWKLVEHDLTFDSNQSKGRKKPIGVFTLPNNSKVT